MGNRSSKSVHDAGSMRGDAETVPGDADKTVPGGDAETVPGRRSIRALIDNIFELTGSVTFPTDPVGNVPDPAEYTPVVDLDDAPDPYPEGFEIMGSSTVPTDAEGLAAPAPPEFDPAGPTGPVGPMVDPYDAGAVRHARTKPGPEPTSFAVADVKGQRIKLVPASVNAYTPVGTIYDIAADPSSASDVSDVNKIPISVGEPAVIPGGVLACYDACPEEPDPYDKHAPRQGLLCEEDKPCRWYGIATKPELKDRDDVFEVRYGDHVAFFGRDDVDAVAALLPLHPEQAQPSANKDTLVRLRLNLALGTGTPPCDLVAMNDVARMFQDALEPAGDGASVSADDLEACLQKWVMEPTRYGPFKDLAGAVDFMRLPVRDGRVVGVALKERYVTLRAAARAAAAKTGAVTNVTSTNLQLRSEPKAEFARVSIWNEPPRATGDENDRYMKPLLIDGRSFEPA